MLDCGVHDDEQPQGNNNCFKWCRITASCPKHTGCIASELEVRSAIAGVTQKNQTGHRHGVFGGGELGIGTQLVGSFPKFIFELPDIYSIVLVVLPGSGGERFPS